MQILKYEKDQHYHPHNDWFHTAPEKSEENGKQRWITILHYLNNYGEDYTGGEARAALVLPALLTLARRRPFSPSRLRASTKRRG